MSLAAKIAVEHDQPSAPATFDDRAEKTTTFWQMRFYDFNVWSMRKKNEKLNYMSLAAEIAPKQNQPMGHLVHFAPELPAL